MLMWLRKGSNMAHFSEGSGLPKDWVEVCHEWIVVLFWKIIIVPNPPPFCIQEE